MNNNSFVIILADKLAAIMETGCPPVSSAVCANRCIDYDGDCRNCWCDWLKDDE